MILLFDWNDELAARVAVAEDERDAEAWALDEERVESTARLLEATEGAELDIRDAEERQDEEREESARQLAEQRAEAARAREEDLGTEVAALANEPCMIVS